MCWKMLFHPSFLSSFLRPPSLFCFCFLQSAVVHGLCVEVWVRITFPRTGGDALLSQALVLSQMTLSFGAAQSTFWAGQDSRLTALTENVGYSEWTLLLWIMCSHRRDASGLRGIQGKIKALSLPSFLISLRTVSCISPRNVLCGYRCIHTK